MNRADWGDPLDEFSDEYDAFKKKVASWLTLDEQVDLDEALKSDDPAAAIAGDGEKEKDDWRAWILVLFLAVFKAGQLGVSATSAVAKAWQKSHIAAIEAIAKATQDGLRAALDLDLSADTVRLAYGLYPQQVATLANLQASLEAEGLDAAEVAARLAIQAEALRVARGGMISESEMITGHAGAVVSSWRTAIEDGVLPADTKRTWKAFAYGNICDTCRYLDGQTVGMDQPFIDLRGNEYDGPAIHPFCRCRLTINQDTTVEKSVKRADYVVPSAGMMTPETTPPALAAGMGPIAGQFFAGVWNALTAAGVSSGMALSQAQCCMYMAGFYRQPDGTWTRSEDFEQEQAEYAQYYEPSGVMRADVERKGATLSAKNARMLRSIHDGMGEHMAGLSSFLESCGAGMGGESSGGESDVEESRSIQINRAEITGESFLGWSYLSTGDDGKPVYDSYNTNFPVDVLSRAADDAAMSGQNIGINDEHGVPVDGMVTQRLAIDDDVVREIIAHPNRRGLMIRAKIWDDAAKSKLKGGTRGLSIEGSARFEKAKS
jgi:hypothetical protein